MPVNILSQEPSSVNTIEPHLTFNIDPAYKTQARAVSYGSVNTRNMPADFIYFRQHP